jgi:hypothetical protein
MASNVDQLLAGVAGGGLAQNTYLQQQAGDQDAQLRQQQLQAGQMQLKSVQHQQARDASYQQDVQDYFQDPKPQKLGNLMMKYPDKADQIKQSKAVLDEPARQSQMTQYGSLYSAANSGRADLVRTLITNIQTAEKAKGIVDPETDDAIAQLSSTDAATQKTALKNIVASTQVHLAAIDPKYAESLTKLGGESYTLHENDQRYDSQNNLVASGPKKQEYLVVHDGEKAIPLNGAPSLGQEGGGQAVSGGAAAGTRGDVSRLINTDAGGGYVPSSVGTLGQFVSYGKTLNNRGAKSSSAGTYQINGTTMSEFGPKALGPDWKNAPYNADSQEKIGEAIFDWAKQQRDPAAALRGRWVSLSPQKAAQLVQGDWQQARGVIAQGETGGGAGSSASRAPQVAAGTPGDPAGTIYGAPKSKDAPSGYQWNGGSLQPIPGGPADKSGGTASGLVGPAFLATLPPGRASLLKAINDGRAPAPRPGSRFGEQLSEDMAQAFPSVDVTTLPMRQTALKDFTGNGKAAQVMSSLGRFAAHLNSAWENHLQLGGMNLGPASGLVAGLTQSFDPAHVKGYNTELEALQGEFQKLSKNGAASETEGERLIANAKPAQSETGRAAALQAMAKLALAQYPQMINQWHSAFPDRPLPVDLSPGSMASLQNIIHGGKSALPVDHNGAPYVPHGNNAASQGGPPVRVSSPAQAAGLPAGTLYIAPDGKVRKR